MGANLPREWEALIAGRYALHEVIGRGGMGEVWAGTDLLLGRAVAVKVMHEHLAEDDAARNRFGREARAVASLNHPRIAAVFDAGVLPGAPSRPYMVMEYVEGRTVAELLATLGTPTAARALGWVSGILDALECAHASGIVHREIKPSNVMVTSAGPVKVMDFGIVHVAGSGRSASTATYGVVGTAAYMAPEQAQGHCVDARSDLYSVGCLLYELLSGRPPHVGETPLAVMYGHVHESPVPLNMRTPGIPADLDALVLRALAKEPADRFASAADMRNALALCNSAVPIPEGSAADETMPIPGADDDPVPPAMPNRSRPRRRRPIHAAVWAAAPVFVAGVVVAAAWNGGGKHLPSSPDATSTASAPANHGAAASPPRTPTSSSSPTVVRASATRRDGAASASGSTSTTTPTGGSTPATGANASASASPSATSTTSPSFVSPPLPPPPALP